MRSVKASTKEPASDPNVLRVTEARGRSNEAVMAEMAYDPVGRSLAGARQFIKNTMGEQALTESLEALNAKSKRYKPGTWAARRKP